MLCLLLVAWCCYWDPRPADPAFSAPGSKKCWRQNGDALNERKRVGKITKMCRVVSLLMVAILGLEGPSPAYDHGPRYALLVACCLLLLLGSPPPESGFFRARTEKMREKERGRVDRTQAH